MDARLEPIVVIEAEALVTALYRAYGYDFRQYSQTSQVRRLVAAAAHLGCSSLSMLQHRLLHEPEVLTNFMSHINVSHTEFFRDLVAFQSFKGEVIPFLSTFSQIKIWHAGCSTGEELFSVAIMLRHAGLLERARLYGTDINPRALAAAREGIFSAERLDPAETTYAQLQYNDHLRNHFTRDFGAGIIAGRYRARAVFSDHNLATDANFGRFEFISCRNVLLYFNDELRTRVLGLFREALVPGGYLLIGSQETLPREWLSSAELEPSVAFPTSPGVRGGFECIDRDARLYRRCKQEAA